MNRYFFYHPYYGNEFFETEEEALAYAEKYSMTSGNTLIRKDGMKKLKLFGRNYESQY